MARVERLLVSSDLVTRRNSCDKERLGSRFSAKKQMKTILNMYCRLRGEGRTAGIMDALFKVRRSSVPHPAVESLATVMQNACWKNRKTAWRYMRLT